MTVVPLGPAVLHRHLDVARDTSNCVKTRCAPLEVFLPRHRHDLLGIVASLMVTVPFPPDASSHHRIGVGVVLW